MAPLRHTTRTLQYPVYNPYPGRREKKSYRYGYNPQNGRWEVKTKVNNPTQKNARNAAYNYNLGNDDPIRPYLNPVEGKAPRRGDYPDTKNAVATFTAAQWELCGRTYNFDWNVSPQQTLEDIREQWRGLTNTQIHN
ncbi:hypothetical protein BJ508DRAFT_322195 [Ascobolus immersus RN42]|uniref:Uncharacterized protein n=1 Tax=Ascobolus immersus RN42 TaxID=1160509 RepID=A0A3N4IJP7_ASCIM|nr:hypothetical protein BJ508DRAFT_322195 [Ascobolus immersus RN42]